MGESIAAIIIAGFGGGGIASLIGACLQRKWQKEDKKDERIDALVNAQKVVMIDRVRWLSKQYIAQNCISLEDKENLKEMYKAYKALGGNGHLDTSMAEVEKIRVNGEDCA